MPSDDRDEDLIDMLNQAIPLLDLARGAVNGWPNSRKEWVDEIDDLRERMIARMDKEMFRAE